MIVYQDGSFLHLCGLEQICIYPPVCVQTQCLDLPLIKCVLQSRFCFGSREKNINLMLIDFTALLRLKNMYKSCGEV